MCDVPGSPPLAFFAGEESELVEGSDNSPCVEEPSSFLLAGDGSDFSSDWHVEHPDKISSETKLITLKFVWDMHRWSLKAEIMLHLKMLGWHITGMRLKLDKKKEENFFN